MASRRLSRPRTRIYDVNYNIGENYYRPAIDRLDRKFTGRPLSPAARQSSIPLEIQERHERAFADDDLSSARARASKTISEQNVFDTRHGILASRAMDVLENELDEETASKLQRIRANKKVSIIDDLDLDGTMNNIKARNIRERTEKMLDAIGIDTIDNTKTRTEDVTYKRRSLKITSDSSDSSDLTKWSKVNAEEDSSATLRARQSRARLNELEDEMNAMAEKAQVRERRAARLRALVAETAVENEASEAIQSVAKRIGTRQRKEIRESIEY